MILLLENLNEEHDFLIEKKTNIYKQQFNEKRVTVVTELVNRLAPYDSPKRRIFYTLKQLLTGVESTEWEHLKLGIQTINKYFLVQ